MMRTNKHQIYLASSSPRRAELLTQMGVSFQTISINVPEVLSENESCHEYVSRLAQEKAKAGLASLLGDDLLVIGADTVIFMGNEILEKPADQRDAFRILSQLSNKTHSVLTAVSVCHKNMCETLIQTNQVTMRVISQAEITQYWLTGEPHDKAGAYGIQGKGALFIKHIEGSYSGIMGLPIYETARLLNSFGVKCL